MTVRHELAWGGYLAFVWNLGVAAIVNNPLESSTRTWFIVMGAANELLGVLMIASPELLDLGTRILRWLALRAKRVGNILGAQWRRLLRVPYVIRVTPAGDVGFASEGATVQKMYPTPRTLDEVVEWLLRHEDELQRQERLLGDMQQRWQREIEEARKKSEELARALVAGLAGRRLALRLLGLLFVVIGLLLGLVGNLV